MKVICVHGYLAPKAILWPLAHRLRQHGLDVEVFGYPSHKGTLQEHGNALAQFVRRMTPQPVAIVAHSLGGLVTQEALTNHTLDVERIVFIATPLAGNRRSRILRRTPVARFLSDAAKRTATVQYPNFHHRCVGVLVGDRDYIVAPKECHLSGAKEHLCLPYGHNEILLRPKTARLVARFIRTGAFDAHESLTFLRQQTETS